ncbi:GntR family transcriptional regulator [Rothia nasimurium]|uniref:GntR family transcriptional regulator n=1 Tax=Rothia nasimurium TaxID=85336 RepID=UPI0009F65638|nr:GntR family transcriptional regulator [Rothia nasimurium]
MTGITRETKYVQVARGVRERYVKAAAPHTLLPAERELQAEFGVSRDTVRRALRVLADRGLVYNVQGSGTFVAQRHDTVKAPSLRSFTEDMKARGHRPQSVTLSCHMVEAPPLVARDLVLDAGAKVIEIRRLRSADGSPIAFETAHFLPEAFAQLEPEMTGSLDAQLRRSGFSVESAVQRLSATNLTKEEAAWLEVPQGTAALRVEKVGFTGRGLAVESTQTLYRADRYDFEVRVER